jgi:GT2 family glycosyltransferase
MDPKVSILWVNFNSYSFIQLVEESLKAIEDLDYPNHELIAVDNCSVDGSYAILKNYLQDTRIDSKLIRLKRNVGFTGGNNVAFSARDPNAKYVVLLNNDAVPKKESLRELIDLLEYDEELGAVQGVILNLDERSIDTAGDYLSELFEATSLFQGHRPRSLKAPVFTTSPDAAYSVLRVKAIRRIPRQSEQLFDNYLFGYFDDHTLGLKLWNSGYKVKVFPTITAKHNRGSSFKRAKHLQAYLKMRNLLILNEISNSRYKNLLKLLCLRQAFTVPFRKIKDSNAAETECFRTATVKGFVDGMRMGKARRRLGERIDIYKAPLLSVFPSTAFGGTVISLQLIPLHLEKELAKIAASHNVDRTFRNTA